MNFRIGDLVLSGHGSPRRSGLILEVKNYAHGGYRLVVLWDDGEIYPTLSNFCKVIQ